MHVGLPGHRHSVIPCENLGVLELDHRVSYKHPAQGCPTPLACEDSILLLADIAEGVGAPPSLPRQAALPMASVVKL